jgi:hypothetical protein
MIEYKKNIRVLIFITLLVLSPIISCSILALEENMAWLEFRDLKEIYSKQEAIKFHVYNNSNKYLFFYCAPEIKLGDHWQEITPPVGETRITKTTKLYEIKSKSLQKLNWEYSKHNNYPKIDTGIFRFRIEAMEEPGKEPIVKIFSREFKIE